MSESFAGITVPPGDPGGVESMAAAIAGMSAALEADSAKLRGLPSGMGTWQGPASAAFAGACLTQTDGISVSGQAFTYAAGMSRRYAHALHEAQHEARAAIRDAREAQQRIDNAQRRLDDANSRAGAAAAADTVATAQVLATGLAGTPSPSALADQANARNALSDAEGDATRAQHDLTAAQDDLKRAQARGRRAEQAAHEAAQGYAGALNALGASQLPPPPPPPSPPKPEHRGFWGSIGHGLSSAWDTSKNFVVDTGKGVGDFAVGMKDVAVMGWKLSPIYGAYDPSGQQQELSQLGHGLSYAWNHPGEFGKQLIDWKDIVGGHPGRAFGQLLPNIVLTAVTAGGGAAAKGAEGAEAVSKLAKGADAVEGVADAGKGAGAVDAAAGGAARDLPPVTYRGDSRAPEEIFAKGFEPRGTSTDLQDYAAHNSPSAFVGTSLSPDVGTRFAGDGGFRYVIRAPGGIDVNAALGHASPFPDEVEIAFKGGIQSEHIVGAQSVTGPWPDSVLGEFVHNPGFTGTPP